MNFSFNFNRFFRAGHFEAISTLSELHKLRQVFGAHQLGAGKAVLGYQQARAEECCPNNKVRVRKWIALLRSSKNATVLRDSIN